MKISYFRRALVCAGVVVLSLAFVGQPALAKSKLTPKQVSVNCATGSIQAEIDSANIGVPTVISFTGTCREHITVLKDDITIQGVGQTPPRIIGSIRIIGARRVVLQQLNINGPSWGILAERNAEVFVGRGCSVSGNDDTGIIVRYGAMAHISCSVQANGQSLPLDSGRGIEVTRGGIAEIKDSRITDNHSSGIGVYDGGFAKIIFNRIERNGRAAVFDAGVQVSRARVVAIGNRFKDNPYAAIEMSNDSSYRTGDYLVAGGVEDNTFPFEQIEAGTGELAVDVGRYSYMDLRQVNVLGDISVGASSMLNIRGDSVGTNKTCSTVDGDTVVAKTAFSTINLQYTDVTSLVTQEPGTWLLGELACPPFVGACPRGGGSVVIDGSIRTSAPLSSVAAGDTEDDSRMVLFREQACGTLSTALNAEITSPTTVTGPGGTTPGVLAVGTNVNSFFVHFDTATAGVPIIRTASISFNADILAVMLFGLSLDASDLELGNAGTIYPAPGDANRGTAEPGVGEDRVELSADRRTLHIRSRVTEQAGFSGLDQLRILTAAP